jgi:hypothetical protein
MHIELYIESQENNVARKVRAGACRPGIPGRHGPALTVERDIHYRSQEKKETKNENMAHHNVFYNRAGDVPGYGDICGRGGPKNQA